ncbi:MAG: hypothetical protein LBF90_02730 [Prevotellaceae bacterium]|jgi:hypothetical protein|nr:hypothetical protein [Prevotellaceae bacterium]
MRKAQSWKEADFIAFARKLGAKGTARESESPLDAFRQRITRQQEVKN